jgi:hypothetical protein
MVDVRVTISARSRHAIDRYQNATKFNFPGVGITVLPMETGKPGVD